MKKTFSQWDFQTRQIHAGTTTELTTGASNVPIYQSAAYQFRDSVHAANLFDLKEEGYIYSRINNPTINALQKRLSDLEGGVGAIACSSGHAAQIMSLFPLMRVGKNLVASTRLYGGTITQFSQTIKRFGWNAKFVDFDDIDAIHSAINENTCAIFCESISNPGNYVSDLEAVGILASNVGLPLIVDNTIATPYLCNPITYGATLVTHSLTKYLTGNGSIIGGIIIDSGKFDWSASDKFPSLSEPEPAYHNLRFYKTFGELAFTVHSTAVGLRDLGMTLNPQAAHYTLMGIETLSLRMQRHCKNAIEVAEWLEQHPAVESVAYAGLKSSSYYTRSQRLYRKGVSSLFTFTLKGGYNACKKLIDSLHLFSHVANLGDAKSLIIHPASTTHRQLNAKQQVTAGVNSSMIRVSIGLEETKDIIADLAQALA